MSVESATPEAKLCTWFEPSNLPEAPPDYFNKRELVNDMQQRLLRIANITEDGRYAGPQSRIIAVAERLRRLDIETTVICPTRESERFQTELSKRTVRYIAIDLTTLGKQAHRLVRYVRRFPIEVFLLVRIFREERFDLAHCNASWQWKGLLAAKLTGTKAVWHLNDTSAPKPVMLVFRFLARYCASGFIVAGDRVRDYYLAPVYLSRKPTHKIPAPVDCDALREKPAGSTSPMESAKGIRVATLANVNPHKDIATLIRVAHEVNRIRGDTAIDFFVFGGLFDSQAKYISQLKALRAGLKVNNVHFMGPTDDISAVLHGADIYLCTSRSEASPMAVWEAAASRLPIVSTDVGDIFSLNTTWRFALTAGIEQAEDLARAIVNLATCRETRTRTGKRGQQLAAKFFDISDSAKHMPTLITT